MGAKVISLTNQKRHGFVEMKINVLYKVEKHYFCSPFSKTDENSEDPTQ